MPNLYITVKSISWGTFWVACAPEVELKCKCPAMLMRDSLRNFLYDAGLPSRRSFSSLLASLLSRRSCFSISALIRLDSFASSLRQQAIMESKVITAWAEKPVWQGEPGYTSHKISNKWNPLQTIVGLNKVCPNAGNWALQACCRIWPSLPMVKLLSSVKYLTV